MALARQKKSGDGQAIITMSDSAGAIVLYALMGGATWLSLMCICSGLKTVW